MSDELLRPDLRQTIVSALARALVAAWRKEQQNDESPAAGKGGTGSERAGARAEADR